MTTLLNLPFIKNDWTISLGDLPKYAEFKGQFIQQLDTHILKMCMESNNLNITPLMKQEIEDKIIKNINTNTGELSVFHEQRNSIGRFYPNGNVSLIPHSKYIKHTVFKYLGWKDLDMVKGHMTIACEMGKTVGLCLNSINKYISSFDEICDEARQFYQLDEDENALTNDNIKYLYCLMMYGGGISRWVTELQNGDDKSGYKSKQIKNADKYSPFAKAFKDETKNVIDRIYTKNPGMVRKLKKPDEELYKTKSSVASYWFQAIENHILHIVYCHLCEQKLIRPKYCGLEYDGLCIPPFLKQVDEDQLINDINTLIRLKTGLDIRMKFKDYSPAFVLEDIIQIRNEFSPPIVETPDVEIGEPNPELGLDGDIAVKYMKWKKDFEKEWCKIKNNGIFVRRYQETSGEISLVFHTRNLLTTAYEHICDFTMVKNVPKRVSFIQKWLTDKTMRCYESMQCIPPPLVCPKNVYNLWIDSPFEAQPIDDKHPDYNEDAVSAFAHHIEILSNHDKTTFEYVCNWIAQSIQRPGEKMGVALNFIGDQGIGKNTFTDILVELYGGTKKKVESAQPERDVWGQFNDLMVSAFLVILNETDKRNTIGHDGKIKACITDSTITISPKGKTSFTMDSYHRFIQNTNNEDPTQTSKSDRRNVIIRCSDEKKGETEYFKELNKVLHSPNALRSIYWEFKSMDISGFNRGDKIMTEYHDTIIQYNEDPLRLFMKSFVETNAGVVEVTPVELLTIFSRWRADTKIKFGEHMNVLSLLKQIKFKLNPPEDSFYTKHTRGGNIKCIDTDKMAAFLGMEHLTETEMDDSIEIQQDSK